MTDDIDRRMMQRCIELSREITEHGEFPFACVICQDGEIVAEVGNRVARQNDVTQHAEVLAVSRAQKALGTKDLSRCTIYSNVEPCAMCSFPIRETKISRVVFAISSPLMGGYSKWGLLTDETLGEVMPEVFGPAPQVRAGFMAKEAAKAWRNWNPLIWGVIRYRGCFDAKPEAESPLEQRQKTKRRGRLARLFSGSSSTR